MRTAICTRLNDARPQPLTGELEQTKCANSSKLDAGPVDFDRLRHPLFYCALVAAFLHIDEIDDNQASQIT